MSLIANQASSKAKSEIEKKQSDLKRAENLLYREQLENLDSKKD